MTTLHSALSRATLPPSRRRSMGRLVVLLAAALSLPSRPVHALINLGNFGPGAISTTLVVDDTGGNLPPGGGGLSDTVAALQGRGYTCVPGRLDEIQCRSFAFEPQSEKIGRAHV